MLTKRQTEVLEYIILINNIKNRMPTKTELYLDLKITRGSLQRILEILVDQGKLKRNYPDQIEFSIVREE